MFFYLLVFLLPFTTAKNIENKVYKPNWEDLDSRPLPQWYDEAKVGILLHWGVYSVPSFGGEWFWLDWHAQLNDNEKFMAKNYPAGFTYQDFAPMFTAAEFFDPNEWASLFQRARAKYIVLTTKHHEGYTLFPSKRSLSWNSVDVGPRRDLVGELSSSVREAGLKFGVYHSLYEWFNPTYDDDKDYKEYSFRSRQYPDTKLWPEIKQLVNDYKPSVLWADGDWEAPDSYWNSTGLLAWLYNDSPVKDEIVTNDRWGIGCYGRHGDFYNYADRYNPGKLLAHKWENAFGLDSLSWGYRRHASLSEIMSFDELLFQVVSTVSCGGNALINVGPTKEGTISPIFQDRLLSLGEWLSINGEAIYKSSPWTHQNDSTNGNVWYTCRKTSYNATRPSWSPSDSDTVIAIYAIMLKWPQNNHLIVADVKTLLDSGNYKIEMLGIDVGILEWKITDGNADITLPNKAELTSSNAWTLKFTLI